MAFCKELALFALEERLKSIMQTDPDRWQRLKDMFNDVNELPLEDRSAYLSTLKVSDQTLFQELSNLLDAEHDSEHFLQNPLFVDSDRTFIGERVGHYKIVREIGRGGMGVVFEAVREDGEFEQKAAIKLTNRNLLSDELIRRFRSERQILARLEHKNIVRLFDGGITSNYVPYFVMEFVEGVPVTRFCFDNGLTVRERLDLFLQVCDAVAYAHQQLIVHRDLKPSNIIVTADRHVKLLDFGIAKTLDPDAQTLTVNTPLTPEYASPEQIRGDAITTASDVFSLGVILYELLTEFPPCDIYGVDRLNLPNAVCEVEPVRPSSVVARPRPNGGEKLTNEIAGQRTGIADQMTRSLQGDLDNIVLKALQKDRQMRYSSVEQFAEDIKAHLNGLPVNAHPQSFGYLASKFVRRNRVSVTVGISSILLIVSVASFAVWQAVVASKQKQIAEHHFDQVRTIANSLILDYHDEIAKLEGSTQLREKLVLDALSYLDGISSDETDNPELLKEIAVAYRKIGNVQGMPYAANLGKTNESIRNCEKGIVLLEKAIRIAPADVTLKDELVKSYSEIAQILERKNIDPYQFYKKAVDLNEVAMSQELDNAERKVLGLRLKVLLTGATSYGDDNGPRIEDYSNIIDEAESLLIQQPGNIGLVGISASCAERIANIYRWQGLHNREKGLSEAAQTDFVNSTAFARKALQYMTRRQEIDPNDNNNKRRLFVANLNLSNVLVYGRQLNEAEKYQQVAAAYIAKLKEKDTDNKETSLDELAILKNKLEIAVFRGQPSVALQVAVTGAELAETCQKEIPENVEALNWVGYFSSQRVALLKTLGKEKEVETQVEILEKIKRKFREQFKTEPDFSGLALG